MLFFCLVWLFVLLNYFVFMCLVWGLFLFGFCFGTAF